MRKKYFLLLNRIVFLLITLMTVMPSFLSAYTAIDVLAAEIGTVQMALPMDDGTASATGTVNGSGTAVDWVVTVTKFDSEDKRAPKLELEYSSGLGTPYNISTNVQQINRTDIGAVTVLKGYTYSTAAETLTMSFTTDITDHSSETISLKILAGTLSEEESGAVDIFMSGNVRTLSLVNPIAQAAAEAAAQAEAEAAAQAEAEAAAQAEAEAAAQAEAEAAAQAEAEAAAQAEAEAAAQAEAEAAAQAETVSQSDANVESTVDSPESSKLIVVEELPEQEIELDSVAEPVSLEGIANDPIIPVPPIVALLFGKSTLAFGVNEGLALAATTYSDTIQVNKTALRNLGCRTYEVTLTITGIPPLKPVDVVLVLDRSGSMSESAGRYSRLYYAKQAAINFAGLVLTGPNAIPGSQVAVVSFSGPQTVTGDGIQSNATENLGFSTNMTLITNTINGLNASGGTNTQAGFNQAGTTLNGANADSNKVVIMFTDGIPTASNGNQYGPSEPTVHNVHTIGAYTAGQALHPRARVFTIGLLQNIPTNVRTLAIDTLTKAQNAGFYEAPSAQDLQTIFASISQQLNYSALNAVVTDVVGNNFNLIESSLPAGAVYNPMNRTITWSPGTIITNSQLKYTVQAKPEFEGGLAYTNESATLNYTNVNGVANQAKTFPKPQVNVPTRLSVSLTDATILLGDSIQLAIGNDPASQNYMSPITGGDGNGTYTYAWYVDGSDTVISTAENPSVSPTVDTKYKLIVTDSSGCKAIAYMWVRVKTGSLTIRKENESGTVITDNPATFTLTKNSTTTTQVTAANGFAEFTGLTRGTYTLKETVAPTGYIADPTIYTVTVGLSTVGAVVVTVTKPGTPNPTTVSSNPLVIQNAMDKIDIPVTKTWNDNNNLLQTRPSSITVNIYQNYQEGDSPYDTIVITPDLNGVWNGVFEDLPKFESPNELYIYTIEEVGVDKYTAVVTPSDNGFTITNTLNVGSLVILKVDKSDPTKNLAGAIFELRKADDSIVKDINGNEVRGTTDSDGLITWANIPYGTYKLVEIQAPDGFNLLDEDIEVVIDADHTDVSKTIENVPVKELPATGGMGTTVFTLVGLAIMIGSGFVYKKKK
ncbi:LPXTG-motif cell wall anchor domain-containing protein [Trichococcus flocculiformis]|uniref:SpaA isopeptide-forming pilin-related protein n=1 Tax=Trichococcus flocculiformis TaxID=82803 RepID=UPI00091145DC|nr:SpaA isopeptide-forming pilin-related protein [Trichococcus flocculiformis]SHF34474.1 LPXTG-motif cell wall anchor domain-containing protein [Trichococcus flocculiformis]